VLAALQVRVAQARREQAQQGHRGPGLSFEEGDERRRGDGTRVHGLHRDRRRGPGTSVDRRHLADEITRTAHVQKRLAPTGPDCDDLHPSLPQEEHLLGR
jgi:hypothetical protein